MSNDRITQLRKFHEEDPKDPFNLYGLALEYLKHDLNKSKQLFDMLLNEHPGYLPTYYHAGKLYQDLNEREMAASIYQKGLQLAHRLNDMKAKRELQSAYDELME